MRRTTRLAALLLALVLALSCTACGKQKALVAGTTSDTKQEQTTDTRKDDTAKTDTAKADSKQDAAKTEDKTVDDKKPDEQKVADEAKKTEEDIKKQEEAKRLEEQKRLEEEKKQQEQEQPAAPDPDPEPAPAPDPAPAASVSLYISCANAVGIQSGLPAGGVLLSSTTSITPGETVMQVLQRACRDAGIPMVNKSGYISAIGGVYDHISDAYPSSGWMYCVDGWFPNYGAGSYTLSGGESIQWLYTLDGGADVGNTYMG